MSKHTPGPWVVTPGGPGSPLIKDADAKLIAAAPEMLEALRVALHAMNATDLASHLEAREYVRVAIAKADSGPCHKDVPGTQNLCTRQSGHHGEHRCSAADVDSRK